MPESALSKLGEDDKSCEAETKHASRIKKKEKLNRAFPSLGVESRRESPLWKGTRAEERKWGIQGLRGDMGDCSGRSAAGFWRKEGASESWSSGEHPGHTCILSFPHVANMFSIFSSNLLLFFSISNFLHHWLILPPPSSKPFFPLICLFLSRLCLSLISNHLWSGAEYVESFQPIWKWSGAGREEEQRPHRQEKVPVEPLPAGIGPMFGKTADSKVGSRDHQRFLNGFRFFFKKFKSFNQHR